MNGKRFVLDSNFVLNYLKGWPSHLVFMKKYEKHDLSISIITEMELLSFPRITDIDKELLKDFLLFVEVVPMDETIKDIAIAFRRKTQRKLPDAIIAATAISLNSCLVTSDESLLASIYPGFTAIKP